ncbi:36836_t:CDS:2, partial [Racocetra persica]
MTCCYDNSHDTGYTFQNSDTSIQSHYNDEVDNNQENGKTYRPLPSHCTELPTHPKRIFEDFVPLPELVLFIQKVTTKARID